MNMNTKFKDEGYNKKESSKTSKGNVYGGRAPMTGGADAQKASNEYRTTGEKMNHNKNSKSGFFNY